MTSPGHVVRQHYMQDLQLSPHYHLFIFPHQLSQLFTNTTSSKALKKCGHSWIHVTSKPQGLFGSAFFHYHTDRPLWFSQFISSVFYQLLFFYSTTFNSSATSHYKRPWRKKPCVPKSKHSVQYKGTYVYSYFTAIHIVTLGSWPASNSNAPAQELFICFSPFLYTGLKSHA